MDYGRRKGGLNSAQKHDSRRSTSTRGHPSFEPYAKAVEEQSRELSSAVRRLRVVQERVEKSRERSTQAQQRWKEESAAAANAQAQTESLRLLVGDMGRLQERVREQALEITRTKEVAGQEATENARPEQKSRPALRGAHS